MTDGNPMLMLEKGEKVLLPPTLWIQSRPDFMHDYRDPDSPIDANEPERFVANYRKAGGQLQLEFFEGPSYDLVRTDPESESARGAVAKIIAFIHQETDAAKTQVA